MFKPTFAILLVLLTISLSVQDFPVYGRKISQPQITTLFTEKEKSALKINIPIKSAYYYKDKSGEWYTLLSENNLKSGAENTLKVHFLKKEKQGLKIINEISDFTTLNKNSNFRETSIYFLEKFCEFKDLNHDGFIDPIIVYATLGLNGMDDGRIKIFLLYKQQKIAIRHQNGILDFERNTSIDKSFYTLPTALQNHIKTIMKTIEKETNAIFPAGWENAMKNRKLYFDEN